jgi:hypothetical protein
MTLRRSLLKRAWYVLLYIGIAEIVFLYVSSMRYWTMKIMMTSFEPWLVAGAVGAILGLLFGHALVMTDKGAERFEAEREEIKAQGEAKLKADLEQLRRRA